jgi:hypothetical protein
VHGNLTAHADGFIKASRIAKDGGTDHEVRRGLVALLEEGVEAGSRRPRSIVEGDSLYSVLSGALTESKRGNVRWYRPD